MNKKVKFILAIILLITIIVVHISYAKVISKEETKVFIVNKEKISTGETLEMTLNLADISYNNFKFKLNSNMKANDIFTKTDSKVNIGIEEDSSKNLLIQIDKSEINLDKLTLYYVIPESMKVGNKLDLTAQIIITEEVKNEDTSSNKDIKNNTISNNIINQVNNTTNKLNNETTKNNTTNNVVNSSNNTISKTNNKTTVSNNLTNNSNKTIITYEEKVVEEIKVEIEIIEKQEESSQEKLPIQQEQQNTESKKENDNQEETKQVNNQKVSSNISKVTISTQSTTTVQTAVYKGSSNNYLSNLEIEGVDLNTAFNKENNTYFATVENRQSINITATKEDDDAKVCITGENNLTEGQNKILISITAENGDVRYYRVFIENIIGGEDEA